VGTTGTLIDGGELYKLSIQMLHRGDLRPTRYKRSSVDHHLSQGGKGF